MCEQKLEIYVMSMALYFLWSFLITRFLFMQPRYLWKGNRFIKAWNWAVFCVWCFALPCISHNLLCSLLSLLSSILRKGFEEDKVSPILTSLIPSSWMASRAIVMFSREWGWLWGRLLCFSFRFWRTSTRATSLKNKILWRLRNIF